MHSRRTFLKKLALASLALPFSSGAQSKSADLTAELIASELSTPLGNGSNAPSSLWLYNKQLPGPEIRVNRGELVRVRFRNNLQQPSSIHWHGIRISNRMDGVSGLTQKAVPPSGMFDYEFEVPDAGTFWYHAHHRSWEQVGRGLYGPLIVEDVDQTHDVPEKTFILDDWRLDPDGRLLTDFDGYMREKHFGRIGETITVNGLPIAQKIGLFSGQYYRLRFINAANARIFRLNIRGMEAHLVARDGQYIKTAKQIAGFTLAPAQRLDLLVRLEGTARGLIEDANGTLGKPAASTQPASLLQFKPIEQNTVLPNALPVFSANKLSEPTVEAAKHVVVAMEGGSLSNIGSAIHNGRLLDSEDLANAKQVWKFNGIANLPKEPVFRVQRLQTVLLEINNNTGFEHAMHLHGHHFRVLNLDGTLGDWQDTVLMLAQSRIRIAFVADNPGKWLLHCHMLEHAAAGMNTWFEVV